METKELRDLFQKMYVDRSSNKDKLKTLILDLHHHVDVGPRSMGPTEGATKRDAFGSSGREGSLLPTPPEYLVNPMVTPNNGESLALVGKSSEGTYQHRPRPKFLTFSGLEIHEWFYHVE